jgi:hypothetical protein
MNMQQKRIKEKENKRRLSLFLLFTLALCFSVLSAQTQNKTLIKKLDPALNTLTDAVTRLRGLLNSFTLPAYVVKNPASNVPAITLRSR